MTVSVLPVAPASALSSYVRSFLVLSGDDGDSFVRLPDGQADLVLRFTPSYGGVHAIGTRLSVLRKPVEVVPPQTVVVRFKPGGAYPFFGMPMSELTNRVVSIDTLWGADGARLRQRLGDAASATERMHVMEDALAERLRRGDVFEPAGAYLVRRAVRLLTEAAELPRVEELAHELGISARHLRRAFEDVVGVGPKEFARVVRFQRAVRASERAAAPDWGAIASATGYYDQSHLITEFKALTGLTPRALLSASPSGRPSPAR